MTKKPKWNKSSTWGNRAQLKTARIHDSNMHYHAKVWSNLISNLESKAKVITFGKFWYGVPILAVVNKNSQLKHQSLKNSQILPATE
jgi:hypothetical protein